MEDNHFLENKKFNNKSFFINANDELVLENDNKKVDLGIFFKLILSKKSNNLKVEMRRPLTIDSIKSSPW